MASWSPTSASGVTAGIAAGMRVFAFTGSVTEEAALARPRVVTFDAMRSLAVLLACPESR